MISSIKIYRGTSELFAVPVTPNSTYHNELMGSEYVELQFEVPSDYPMLQYNDIVTFNNKTFHLLSLDDYTITKSGGIAYKQKFHASWERWRNIVLFYDRQNGIEAGWGNTNSPQAFLDIICSNLQSAGMGTYTSSVDSNLTDFKYISFEGGIDIISALTQIAQTWDAEWWVDGTVIHLGKCQIQFYAAPFVEGGNVKSLTRQSSQDGQKITKLYAFGSDRNISNRYRKNLIFYAGDTALMNKCQNLLNGNYSAAIIDGVRGITEDMFPASAKEYKSSTSYVSLNKTHEFKGGDSDSGTLYYKFSNADYLYLSDYGKQEYSLYENGKVNITYTGHGTCVITAAEVEVWGANGRGVVAVIPLSVTNNNDGTFTVGCDTTVKEVWVNKMDMISVGLRIHYTNTPPERLFNPVYAKLQISTSYFRFIRKNGNARCATTVTIDGHTYGARFNPFYLNPLEDGANMIAYNGAVASVGTPFTVNSIIEAKVPAKYYSELTSAAIAGITKRNLMLPNEPCYKDAQGNLYRASELQSTDGYTQVYDGLGYVEVQTDGAVVEGVKVLEDIYPRQEAIIAAITPTECEEYDAENDITKTWTEYVVKANSLVGFSEAWLLQGEKLKLTMQDGLLAGMTFDVALEEEYNETTQQYDAVFHILRNAEDYGQPVPNETLYPAVGDKFILSGFDIGFVDAELVDDAEMELLARSIEWLENLHNEADSYTADMLVTSTSSYRSIPLGYPVTLTTYQGVVNTRIRGIDGALDERKWAFQLGKTASYSRLQQIENTVKGLNYNTVLYTNNLQQIKQGVTEKEMNEALDALRDEIDRQRLSKVKEDAASEMIRFNKGIEMGDGDFVQGVSGCKLWNNDGVWCLQVDNLLVNRKMEAKEIQIDEVSHVGGQIMLTSAKCEVDYVQQYNNLNKYNVYFRRKDANGKAIKNEWKKGDYAYCQQMNVDVGNSTNFSNRYYWALVEYVGQTTTHYYIRLNFDNSDTSGALAVDNSYTSLPQPNDHIIQLGHVQQTGETAEAARSRSGAMFISGGAAGQYIAVFDNVQPFTLPAPKIYLSPSNVVITADEIHLTSSGVLELGSKQLVCLNTEGAKTAWLDELGNFITTGVQAPLAQNIDTATKFLQRFIPICKDIRYGDGDCAFICPTDSNYNASNWKVGLNEQPFYQASGNLDGVTTEVISPISSEEGYGYGYGNRYAKLHFSLDMRSASGYINIGYVPQEFNSQSLTDIISIILPYFNVTGYHYNHGGLLTEYCRTPSRLAGEGFKFLSLAEIKSLVGRKMTIVNTTEQAVVRIKLNVESNEDGITLNAGQSVSLEFVNGIYDSSAERVIEHFGVVSTETMIAEYYGWQVVTKQDATKEGDLNDANFGTSIEIE